MSLAQKTACLIWRWCWELPRPQPGWLRADTRNRIAKPSPNLRRTRTGWAPTNSAAIALLA